MGVDGSTLRYNTARRLGARVGQAPPHMASLIDRFRNLGAGLSSFTERWIPDSWIICMMLTSVALLLAVFGAGVGVEDAVLAWGGGMWVLLELAMQFTIVMVAAYACVSSGPVFRLFDRLARVPDPDRPLQAVALVAAGVFALHGLLELGVLLGGVGAVRAFCVSSQSAGRHPCFNCRGLPRLGGRCSLAGFRARLH